jgi:hypothetical protein
MDLAIAYSWLFTGGRPHKACGYPWSVVGEIEKDIAPPPKGGVGRVSRYGLPVHGYFAIQRYVRDQKFDGECHRQFHCG